MKTLIKEQRKKNKKIKSKRTKLEYLIYTN